MPDGQGAAPTAGADAPGGDAPPDHGATLAGAHAPGARLARRPHRHSRRMRWIGTVAFLVGIVALGTYLVELPYYTVSPGSALDVLPRVTVEGAESDDPAGEVLLLFVRQRSDINGFEWLQAALDPDIDLFRTEEIRGGQSREEFDAGADALMALSQLAAKKLALEVAGYEVPPASDGAVVLALLPSRPAAEVLEVGDVVLAADGTPIVHAGDLGEVVRTHAPGESVRLRVLSGGEERELDVAVEADESGAPIIGVYVAPEYDFPVDVDVDTERIGGPSAGLALTLSIIDRLTAGDLTGGASVAVTGTIDDQGAVGEIGGISQKAVAARAAGADLFLVPACGEEASPHCEEDLTRARARAGDLEVVPVATLDDALQVLVEHGGDAVEPLE